jgi:dihydropyrimidinase
MTPLFGETCPQYLTLTEKCLDHPHDPKEGRKYLCSPPLRDEKNQAALWTALAKGDLQVVSSDHSAYRFADPEGKNSGQEGVPFTKVPMGLPGLEARLLLLFSQGVSNGKLGLGGAAGFSGSSAGAGTESGGGGSSGAGKEEQVTKGDKDAKAAAFVDRVRTFVRVSSTNPAKMYGIYPQKGVLAVGSDADIVAWNPQLSATLSSKTMHDDLDYTPYEGMVVEGTPVLTMSRGEIICRSGKPGSSSLEAPAGQRPAVTPAGVKRGRGKWCACGTPNLAGLGFADYSAAWPTAEDPVLARAAAQGKTGQKRKAEVGAE